MQLLNLVWMLRDDNIVQANRYQSYYWKAIYAVKHKVTIKSRLKYMGNHLILDVAIENSEAVRQLQDKLQDSLIEYVKYRYVGNLRRLGHLYMLLPALNHMKLLAKQYWFDVKKDGRIMMHKLFLEMLEADSWRCLLRKITLT